MAPSAPASTTINVTDVTPTAVGGGNATVRVGALVNLQGSFTDPGTEDTHAYLWKVVASNGQAISTGNATAFSFTPVDSGTYTVTFSVTDDGAATGSQSFVLNAVYPDIQMQSARTSTPVTSGGATLSVTYTIANVAYYGPLVLGFYTSTDTVFSRDDDFLGAVVISDPSNLSVGTHTVTFDLGNRTGQAPLPSFGQSQSVDYNMLAVADPLRIYRESDSQPLDANNTVVVQGIYPPTAAIADPSPAVRNTSVPSVTIKFNEPVSGFAPGSLALTLDGKTVPLNGVTLATTDQVTWTVAGLAPLTGASGHYALTLTAAGSGIRDAAGNLISTDSGTSWVMDTVPPTATVSVVSPNPATQRYRD